MKYTLLTEVYGRLEAEALKAFLFAEGIDAQLIQESAGQVYPLAVGELGRVQVFVPRETLETAQALLDEFESGTLDIKIAEEDQEETNNE